LDYEVLAPVEGRLTKQLAHPNAQEKGAQFGLGEYTGAKKD
jgi:hypothetical protein